VSDTGYAFWTLLDGTIYTLKLFSLLLSGAKVMGWRKWVLIAVRKEAKVIKVKFLSNML
jgi:hypothetical protein